MATKVCSTCRIEKELNTDNFHAARGYRDGFTGQCKPCRNKKIAEWQTAHPEALAKASAKYIRTDKGKALSKRQRVKHRDKRNAYSTVWHADNKEHEREYNIKKKMIDKFGLYPEDYEAKFEAQDGLCAICHKPETSVDKNGNIKNLAVDHNHDNNKLRDLLCMNCNQGIGKFKENIETMQSAIQYLIGWKRKHAEEK